MLARVPPEMKIVSVELLKELLSSELIKVFIHSSIHFYFFIFFSGLRTSQMNDLVVNCLDILHMLCLSVSNHNISHCYN